jgi:hypothetical protein
MSEIWRGTHPEDGSELEVVDGVYPDAVPAPDLDAEPQLTSPDGPDGPDPEMLKEYAQRLFGKDLDAQVQTKPAARERASETRKRERPAARNGIRRPRVKTA